MERGRSLQLAGGVADFAPVRGAIRHRLQGQQGPIFPRAGEPSPKRRASAAVLVPLIAAETGTRVILTRRAAHLAAHAGQISFPGGRVDDTDSCVIGAALREAEEEIGLDPHAVDILGQMGTYLTVTGYLVTPVVAAITASVALRANPDEVDDIFTVPLSFLRDPDHRRTERLRHEGRGHTVYRYQYGPHDIWGATAAMLVHLVDHIVQDPAA